MELTWSDDRMTMAQKIVMERFAQNSVAGHLAPHSTVDDTETTIRRNRFDFAQAIVIDREVFGLNEPFSFCWFSKAQVDEFGTMQGEDGIADESGHDAHPRCKQLARWHDILFFSGLAGGQPLPPPWSRCPTRSYFPQSLREAAAGGGGAGYPVDPVLGECAF